MKIFNIKNYLICIAITMLMVVLRMIDPFFIETARLKALIIIKISKKKLNQKI